MTKVETLIQEVQAIPEPLLDEILDFVRFLKQQRTRTIPATALARKEVLKRDRLTPEEDEAWRDL
jgi:hypothetical protein